ncbi:MAG TPA: bifunctional phosphoribosylaminoimidazolecarboxamide formyltransferase/IMP cyclohydrolase [Ignavibacteriales bacterium]|nr:bifunctional phosphoribosylaminoimidazolecarboxamide formyltransferase/IMP cyclohydrolase [Ignavibacteriales bacterium]
MKKRALISVFDKTGIVELAKSLVENNYEIISTGGTFKLLKEQGIDVIAVEDVTGFPECFDGRVKTLHPKIHGGILFLRENDEHKNSAEKLDIKPIDMVVVNLYPFKQTVSKDNCSFDEAIENIDIGGPAMIRAAAKNFMNVLIITDINDYQDVLSAIQNENITQELKFKLFLKAISYTSTYDAMIFDYFNRIHKDNNFFFDKLSFGFEKIQELRYGENPHQKAYFYKDIFAAENELSNAIQLHGKELSYNNINDASAAIDLVKEFDQPACVAIKHANPCGVALGEDIFDAYKKCYNADQVSIFGGIVAFNSEVDEQTANELVKIFLEIIIAPAFTQQALNVLKTKKNLRLLQLNLNAKNNHTQYELKKVSGGLLIQFKDNIQESAENFKVVTKKQPSQKELDDLLFAYKVVKHCKSNAIVVAKDKVTCGLGVGQTSRVWAVENALNRSRVDLKGAVLASDAFFPFADSVELAHKAGITAIIQPGGSVKDQDSIDYCDNAGIPMLFTGVRHFKH